MQINLSKGNMDNIIINNINDNIIKNNPNTITIEKSGFFEELDNVFYYTTNYETRIPVYDLSSKVGFIDTFNKKVDNNGNIYIYKIYYDVITIDYIIFKITKQKMLPIDLLSMSNELKKQFTAFLFNREIDLKELDITINT